MPIKLKPDMVACTILVMGIADHAAGFVATEVAAHVFN